MAKFFCKREFDLDEAKEGSLCLKATIRSIFQSIGVSPFVKDPHGNHFVIAVVKE